MSASGASQERGNITRRAGGDLWNLLSLLGFFTVTALIFRSWEFALMVTASLGFHELGHALALSLLRLEWHISFGLVGAWTWSPAEQRARLSSLANACVHLAGPLFSLLLALLALSIQSIWRPADEHLLVLASFSAQVGLLNLLPLGERTDGGKTISRLVHSLDSTRRHWAVLLPVSITVFMMLLYTLIQLPQIIGTSPTTFLLELLLVGVWMAASMFIEASRRASGSLITRPLVEKKMTPRQVYALIMVMWGLLALGLLVSAETPFWLTPDALLGSMRNVVGLLKLFHLMPV